MLGSGTITIISLPPNTFIAPVIVTGSITLDGSLEINLGGAGQNGQIIPVFSGSGEINGTFHSIDVKSTVACQRITGALVQTGTNTYGILLTVDNSGCKKKCTIKDVDIHRSSSHVSFKLFHLERLQESRLAAFVSSQLQFSSDFISSKSSDQALRSSVLVHVFVVLPLPSCFVSPIVPISSCIRCYFCFLSFPTFTLKRQEKNFFFFIRLSSSPHVCLDRTPP